MVYCPPRGDPDAVYNYCPSIEASALFSALYGITSAVHIWQAVRYKKRFCWVLIMGGIWETAGFIIRCISILNPTSQGIFTPQFLLILLAPLWINAFDYMLFGRIVYNYLPDKKIFGIRAQRMGLVFVLLDISSFIVQLGGGLLTTNNEAGTDMINLGLHIYAAGVGFQLLVILTFAGLAYSCERRLGREAELSRARDAQKLLWVLYSTLGLIVFRVIFRLIEFAAPVNASITIEISQHEWYPYVFDSVPMFIALIVLNIWHPGQILFGPEMDFPKLSKAEKKEEKRVRKENRAIKRETKKASMNGGGFNEDGSEMA